MTSIRERVSHVQSSDENLLLEKAQQCDPAALGELYDRYAARIYSYILYRVGDEESAEDLTANVFIKVLDAVRLSKGWTLSFSGWLYRIAHNAVVDYFRRSTHQNYLPLDEGLVVAFDDPVATVEGKIAATAVREAMVYLTTDQQTVIALKFFEGLTNIEAANVMEKSEGAIKSLQYRALAALRRQMERDSGEEDAKTPRNRSR